MANRNYNELAKNNKKTVNKIQHRGREYVVKIAIYDVLLVPIADSCDKGVCVVPSRSMRSQFSARVSLRTQQEKCYTPLLTLGTVGKQNSTKSHEKSTCKNPLYPFLLMGNFKKNRRSR